MNCEVKNYLEEDHRSYRRNATKDRSAAPVSERLRVRILYKPDFFFFFRLSFRNCKSCVYNRDDLPSNNIQQCEKLCCLPVVRFPGDMFIIVSNVECKIRLESDALLLAV